MHISDGVLPPAVALGGYAAALGLTVWSARKVPGANLPKVAVTTAAFFVASLVHVPLGPTSVHLVLPGLVGILLGDAAFVSVGLGLLLQGLLFSFGGLTALGANALMMGVPALVAGRVFSASRGASPGRRALVGGLVGGLATALAALILALLLVTAGEDFFGVAKVALAAHLPVIAIEGAVCFFAVSFLLRVKPELLEGPARGPAETPAP